MEIEVSFKTTFVIVAKDILIDEDIINMLDNDNFDPCEMDNTLHNCIFNYLTNIVNT